MIFKYKGKLYTDYLQQGNAWQYIANIAKQFWYGVGLDVGGGKWPLSGAIPVDKASGADAYCLPGGEYDYIFSSHCLEHLHDPIKVLLHWKSKIKKGGVLFLYLPHPDMEYWLPQNCYKHLYSWRPDEMAKIVSDLGFKDVIRSERDLAWSFSVVGFNN